MLRTSEENFIITRLGRALSSVLAPTGFRVLLVLAWFLLLLAMVSGLDFPHIAPISTVAGTDSVPFMCKLLDRPINEVMPLSYFDYYWAYSLPFGMEFVPQIVFCGVMSLLLFGAAGRLGSLFTGFCAVPLFLLFLHAGVIGIDVNSPGYLETMSYTVVCSLVAYVLVLRAELSVRNFRMELLSAVCIGISYMVKSPLVLLPVVLAAYDILTRKLRRGETSYKNLFLLCVVPYLMLLPWVYMNWRVYGIFALFEHNRAVQNIMSGASGFIYTLDGAYLALGLPPDVQVFSWAVKTILGHPVVYMSAVLERMFTEFTWYPWLFTAFLTAFLRFRSNEKMQMLGLFAAYFVIIHSLLSIDPRYFYPVWPTLILGACALLGLKNVGFRAGAWTGKVFFGVLLVPLLIAYMLASMRLLEYAHSAALSNVLVKRKADLSLPVSPAVYTYAAQIEQHQGDLELAYSYARQGLLGRSSYEAVKTYAYALVLTGKDLTPVFSQRLLDCKRTKQDCLLLRSCDAFKKKEFQRAREYFLAAVREYKTYLARFNGELDVRRHHSRYLMQQSRADTVSGEHIAALMGYILPKDFATEYLNRIAPEYSGDICR